MLDTSREQEDSISPLVNQNLGPFRAACFQGNHWSLAKLKSAGDEHLNPQFALQVGKALQNIGVRRAFGPSPVEFNGAYIDPWLLDQEIVLPGPVYLYRNKEKPADATLIPQPRDAGIFSAGGCGVLVVTLGSLMVFAHCGRESVLDRMWIESYGKSSARKHRSVVDSIAHELGLLGHEEALERVHAWPLFFIKPKNFDHPFDHPQHGAYNQAAAGMIRSAYGCACARTHSSGVRIDLPKIVRAQFMQYGVPAENIHMEHCYLADELPTTRKGGGRYLVAVVRN
jgi:hypothetical protein